MTILATEILYMKSAEVSSASTNGGRMSINEAVSGVVNNVWPHVLQAERTAGSTLYRKLFTKVANDADETLLSATLWNDRPTDAGDFIVMFAGTQTDTQADISSPRLYGAGLLNTNVSIGGSTVIVDVEHADQTAMFADGDDIRISDMADPEASTGNEELHVINGTPSVSGLEVTLTLTDTLANAYTTANDTVVESLIDCGDIETSSDNWVETSSAGTYDEGSYPVILDNIGTINQTVTLTFTDATNFTATSNVSGVSLGSGVVGSDFTPSNGDFTKPYFTLEAAGFGGTWAVSDTIVFDTIPAAYPFWLKRVVPAGTASLAGNSNLTAINGESA